MSGPKLSQAEIERIKQEQMERERQEMLRKLMSARNQYNIALNEIKIIKNGVLDALNSIDPAYRGSFERELKSLLSEISDAPIMSSNPDDYYSEMRLIENSIDEWKNKLVSILDNAKIKMANDKDFSKRNDDLQKISLDGLTKLAEIEPVIIDFSCQYDKQQIDMILVDIYEHYDSRIRFKSEPRLIPFDKRVLASIQQLRNSNISLDAVKSSVQQIINDEADQIRLLKEFDKLYDEYVAISLTLALNPKEKSRLTLEEVRQELNNVRDEYKRRDEMDYIADKINDVMIEQGYTFVSSKVLTKKNFGETEYSLYQDEGSAGVAVYTDDSGAVMMRMTVLGDNSEITNEDREFSYQSQIDFCSRHSDLVDALAERGVYLVQDNYQAPDRQHTFKADVSGQIDISTSASTSTSKTAAKLQKIDRRARRRGRNKKMRAM